MSSASLSGLKAYIAGAVILKEGPASPKIMAVVLQGSVGVFRYYGMKNQKQERVLTQGNIYGEFSLFLGRAPEHTLVALTDSAVMLVDRDGLQDFFAKQPALAVNVVEELCKKLTNPALGEGEDSSEGQIKSSLFPEGHGSYTLPLTNTASLIFPTKTTCPNCGFVFDTLTVFESRLKRDRTDPDQRIRYKEIEPMYYEIITCPNCFLSASSGKFDETDKSAAEQIMQAVGQYILEISIQTGVDRDSFTVFAGYYLAILCAPYIYDNHQLITASLWLKLSRMYQDVEDSQMFLYSTQKALEEYVYCYERLRINDKQSQQVCFMIGEMYMRLDDYNKARQYFFMAKTNKAGSPVLQRQADLRIDDIRDALHTQKEAAKTSEPTK
ncbi:MAG: DUF2225 domain-containing protein [Oscillospiraceae bacterium]|nr:DUF2225 domain-containing protein [Oscillospiraceae bacterium]